MSNSLTADPEYDVIVVGAGFAGLTVARELGRDGRKVLVLDARDRIGGRTWLTEAMGLELELGGTWVHWAQPHVWAELTRYGIGLAPSPTPQRAYWWDGSMIRDGGFEQLIDELDRPNQLLLAGASEMFPLPYSPQISAVAGELDGISMKARIEGLPLNATERTLLSAFWVLNFNGRLDDAAYTQALRWVALTDGDWKLNWQACASFKVSGGTRSLAEAMRADSSAQFRLGEDVRSVESGPESATVVSSAGERYEARDVVITAPLHALARIGFVPPMPTGWSVAAERGQLGAGIKIWLTIQGEYDAFVAMGDADWPITFFQSEYVRDGRTYVIAFGPDATAIDMTDVGAVQELLRRLLPDAVVLETAGHDWVADELSGETWPMHRTGYLTESLAALQSPFGRIRLAGSDVADGWGGFIDGAIESGLTAARAIRARHP